MCIRDRHNDGSFSVVNGVANAIHVDGTNHLQLAAAQEKEVRFNDPVSYTHLDVYKRQVPKFTVTVAPLAAPREEPAPQVMPVAGRSVSYPNARTPWFTATVVPVPRIDVYKRQIQGSAVTLL